MAAYGVTAGFDTATAYKVDFAFEHFLEFLLHVDHVKEGPMRVRSKGHQNVNIAVGTKIITEYGAKEREFDDVPAVTERGNLVLIKRNRDIHKARLYWRPFLPFQHSHENEYSAIVDKRKNGRRISFLIQR